MIPRPPKLRVRLARAFLLLLLIVTFANFMHACGTSWFWSFVSITGYFILGWIGGLVMITAMGLPLPWEVENDRSDPPG